MSYTDECVVERETLLSDVGYDSDSLNVGDDIVSYLPEHPTVYQKDKRVVAREISLSEVGLYSDSLDSDHDIGSRTDKFKVEDDLYLVKLDAQNSSSCSGSF